MASPGKKILVSDEAFYGLLEESEYSSDSEINVNISSGGEQSVSSDEAENASINSSMQHANSGAE
jgi:hypothetical protein